MGRPSQRAWHVLVGVALTLLLGPPGAQALTLNAGCAGRTGNVASLRARIHQANTAGGTNTIRLGAGCLYDVKKIDNYWYGPNGLPAVAGTIIIDGHGATIARDAQAPRFRLFYVGADPSSARTQGYTSPGGGHLTLTGLTLSDGYAQGGDSNGGGGGAGMGGAIFNQGTLRIVDSTLTANTAHGGSAIDAAAGTGGGGIGTSSSGADGGGFGPGSFGGATGGAGPGDTYIVSGGGGGFTESETGHGGDAGGVGGGPATGLGGAGGAGHDVGAASGDGSGGGGGLGGSGSGTASEGTGGGFGVGGLGGPHGAFIGGGGGGVGGGGGGGGSGTGATDGAGGGGGGFGAGGGAATDTGRGGNGGFGGGGGEGSGAPGFGGGSPDAAHGGGGAGMGGAIFNMQGTVTIINSTVAGNSAVGGVDNVADHGKGIAGAVFNLSGRLIAVDSTFARNVASTSASGIYNLVYDAHLARSALTTLSGTIVANGVGPFDLASRKASYIAPSPNLGTAKVDVSRFDLVETMKAEEQTTITGSPLTADPKLGALRDNGGLTQTMAPAPGSPVLDKGSALGQRRDQRGVRRPADFPGLGNRTGDGSDIGAVELQQRCRGQATPAQACHPLAVVITGPGRVLGSGISCPSTCTASFGATTRVALTRKPGAGAVFTGWGGACHGTGACRVPMNRARRVTATFKRRP